MTIPSYDSKVKNEFLKNTNEIRKNESVPSFDDTIAHSHSSSALVEATNNSEIDQTMKKLQIIIIGLSVSIFCFLYSFLTLWTVLSFILFNCFGFLSIITVFQELQKNGIQSFLPKHLLYNEFSSIHELLKNMTTQSKEKPETSALIAKFQILVIYFIPLLNVDEVLEKLPERRREFLTKKWKLGDLLNPRPKDSQSPETSLVLTNDLEAENDDVNLLQRESIPMEVFTSSTQDTSKPNEEELTLEQQIINEAVACCIQKLSNSLVGRVYDILHLGSHQIFSLSSILKCFTMSTLLSTSSLVCHRSYLKSGAIGFQRGKYLSIMGTMCAGTVLAMQIGLRRIYFQLQNQVHVSKKNE